MMKGGSLGFIFSSLGIERRVSAEGVQEPEGSSSPEGTALISPGIKTDPLWPPDHIRWLFKIGSLGRKVKPRE